MVKVRPFFDKGYDILGAAFGCSIFELINVNNNNKLSYVI
jgi:hypothetical protein